MRLFKKLWLLGIILVSLNALAVNEFWVDSVNGNNANSGAQNSPWATIQWADQHATLGVGGTIVHVRPGNYSGPINTNLDGTPSNRVVYISDTKWAARIGSSNWTMAGNYSDVNGFDLTNPADGTSYGVGIAGGTISAHILNNNMHDFALNTCAQFGIVNVGSGQATSLAGQAQDAWVKNNIIRRISSYTGSGQNTHSCVTAHSIYDFGVRTIIQGNFMSASSGPAIERVSVNGTAGQVQGVISGNTIVNNGGGININESIDSNPVVPYNFNTISNNIIVNNGIDDSISGGACGIDYYHVTGQSNLTTNNLIYGNKPHDLCHHDQTLCGTDASGANPATGNNITGTDGNGNAGGCPHTNPKTDASGWTQTFVNPKTDTPTNPLSAANFNPNDWAAKLGSSAVFGGSTACAGLPGITPCSATVDFNGTSITGNPVIGFMLPAGTVVQPPAAPTNLTATPH